MHHHYMNGFLFCSTLSNKAESFFMLLIIFWTISTISAFLPFKMLISLVRLLDGAKDCSVCSFSLLENVLDLPMIRMTCASGYRVLLIWTLDMTTSKGMCLENVPADFSLLLTWAMQFYGNLPAVTSLGWVKLSVTVCTSDSTLNRNTSSNVNGEIDGWTCGTFPWTPASCLCLLGRAPIPSLLNRGLLIYPSLCDQFNCH